MTNYLRRTAYEPDAVRNGTSYPAITDPEEAKRQDHEGGLDALYFVTNNALYKRILSVLEQGASEEKYDLVTLDDIASRRMTRIGEFTNDRTAYEVMVENIDRLTGEFKDLEEKEVAEITSNYPVAQPGDVLYLRLRPYRRKVTVVPETTQVGMKELDLKDNLIACSGEICVLQPPDKTDLTSYSTDYDWHPEYLQMILQSDVVLFQLLPSIKGGTRPRVPFSEIMSVKIPYPERELREQMVDKMTSFQKELMDLKEKYNNLMGPGIFDSIGVSGYDGPESNLIMDGMDENLVSLLIEADLLPESFTGDPFDQLS